MKPCGWTESHGAPSATPARVRRSVPRELQRKKGAGDDVKKPSRTRLSAWLAVN